MNYKQAVEAALQGNADAFSALYESTQNNMYYLALKYMKNPDDAKDVLQDAYIKAWQSLPTLKDPEHFPAWLGRIVANTAKNMLVKKKPDLFSDLEKENEDGDEFVFQIEDENTSYQPELNYTQKETQILVRELIDSLSDEQIDRYGKIFRYPEHLARVNDTLFGIPYRPQLQPEQER